MRNEGHMTTTDLIPTSRELVTLTREGWGMTKEAFGELLGFTGMFVGQVEHASRKFSDKDIEAGCTHPDEQVRRFWQAYRTARRHEQDVAIIEQAITKEIAV